MIVREDLSIRENVMEITSTSILEKGSLLIRAIIIDDERSGRLVLQTLIQEYCTDIEIVATAESAVEGAHAIRQLQPDLVFLDIEMPFQNGFEMLESMGIRPFGLIFVTAYEQYTTQAKLYAPLDILLKPFNLTSIKNAIEKAKRKMVISG